MLAFLWAGGFAALLLLLVFSHAISAGYGLNFNELTMGIAQESVGVGSSALIWALLAAGFLVKLMLQPFQFFLLSFYRRLAFSALSMYICFYYIFLVPTVIFMFGPGLSALLPNWFLVLVSALLVNIGLLGGSLTSSVDIRSTLAFSTIVNLSILLLALAVWA